MSLDEIKELAGHREVSPWIIKLVQDAVKLEREKVKKVLMAAHELSKQYHNYYHYMALQLDEAMEKIK